MLEHAFRHVDRVVFRVGADNVISRKAMANIGGRLTGETFVEERVGRAGRARRVTRSRASPLPRGRWHDRIAQNRGGAVMLSRFARFVCLAVLMAFASRHSAAAQTAEAVVAEPRGRWASKG